jgi:putative ABC transport system ATP-binding protein
MLRTSFDVTAFAAPDARRNRKLCPPRLHQSGALLNSLSTDPFLDVVDVWKHYQAGEGQLEVLRGLSMRVSCGERVALLGQSGSGKSTLLNLIAGIDTLDGGEISVNGENLNGLSEKHRTLFRRRHIGFIYQSFNLISTLTAMENIKLPLQLNGAVCEEVQQQSEQMIDKVGLAARADAFPDQLSGGEQQRVAIARAMVHRPSLVLADEHTGNLDAQTGARMMALFNEIAAETGQTVVMVTHSEAVAAAADRVIAIRDGAIEPRTRTGGDGLAWQ